MIEKHAALNRQRQPLPAAPGPADLRTAALVLAVERVADVVLKRGIWP